MADERIEDTTLHARINFRSDISVAYWCRLLGVEQSELRKAVQQVGTQVAAVRRYLAQHPAPSH